MKWFLVCVVVAGSVEFQSAAAFQECQAGTKWSTACYDCACSEAGRAECTRKPCTDSDAAVEAEGGRCAPDSAWKNDCNWCHCSDNGQALCTKRGCLQSFDIKVQAECLAGSSWESNCHRCVCSADAQAQCVRTPCADEKAVVEPIRCKPNTSFPRDCNQCTCLDSGLVLCTVRACAGAPETPLTPTTTPGEPPAAQTEEEAAEAELPSGRECAAGTTWKSSCNNCFCSPQGYAGCTLKGCPAGFGKEFLCKPDSRWKDDCNTCFCNVDGIPICTRVGCDGVSIKIPEINFEGPASDKEVSESTEVNPLQKIVMKRETCDPGETIDRDCNTCWCRGDGTGFVCTKRACLTSLPPDVAALKNRRLQKREDEVCEPGQTFKRDCNTCHCNEEGTKYWCTKKGCLKNAEETDSDSADRRLQKREDEVCEPGQTFKRDCNTCHCNEEGTKYWCTKLGCLKTDVGTGSDAAVQVYNGRFKRGVCKPNESFQNECNTCECNAEGTAHKCTQNECMDKAEGSNSDVEVFMENEGTDHIERHSVCQASSTFFVNCNTCQCNYDGTDYRCSDEACPLPDDVELFKELQDETHIVPLRRCAPSRTFYEGCNKCRCNEDGKDYKCTQTVCKGRRFKETKKQDLRIIEKDCRPREVFELDCNTCRCNDDGKSFSCTRRACVTDAPPDAVDYEAKSSSVEDGGAANARTRVRRQEGKKAPSSVKTCEPNQRFRFDCNTCLCNENGVDYSCTRLDCAHTPPTDTNNRRRREVRSQDKKDCEPGSVFSQDCNVCRCTSDGQHATCTLKRCRARPEPDETKEARSQDEDCGPGSVFSQDCNVCRCTSDGQHATCTLKRCRARPEPDETKEPELETGFRCSPGEQFKRSCNDCTCSADGKSVFCTIKLCEKEMVSQL